VRSRQLLLTEPATVQLTCTGNIKEQQLLSYHTLVAAVGSSQLHLAAPSFRPAL